MFSTTTLDIQGLGGLIATIDIALIGIIVTVFVLTVTLMGRAAKLSKEKKAEAEQKSKEQFDAEISKLAKEMSSKSVDLVDAKKKIDDLQVKKAFTETQIVNIQQKYERLSLKEAVSKPGGLITLSLFLEGFFIELVTNIWLEIIVFCVGLFFLCLGVRKIFSTLQVVQETSLETDNYQLKQFQEALIEALKVVDDEKAPKPIILFNEKSPYVFKPNSENTINFQIDLKLPGNKEAKNVDAWFLFSPEIQVLPNEKTGQPFKQADTWQIPKANTIRYKFDLVKKHTYAKGSINIKTTTVGTYRMRYKVDCDNYTESAGPDREVAIIVKE